MTRLTVKQIQLETDVSDDEWAFVAPYLSLMTADAPQRRHNLREVSNALRWIARAAAPGAPCQSICRRRRWSINTRDAG